MRRASDFLALTKPRITGLVLVTTAAGFYMGSRGPADPLLLASALLGTALVASGTNALNQWWEREADALMRRTMARPLPAGRLAPGEALVFACVIGLAGVGYLLWAVNGLTSLLAAITLTSYVFLYTPLKRRTSLSLLVGAVPGALPILGGWTAAGGRLSPVAWALFAILFLWQMPHFLALAWMYRDDYRRGGFAVAAVNDADGHVTGRQSAVYALALVAVSLAPTVWGLAGAIYAVGAVLLGGTLVGLSGAMTLRPTPQRARRLFLASVLYLPALLLLLVAGKIPA